MGTLHGLVVGVSTVGTGGAGANTVLEKTIRSVPRLLWNVWCVGDNTGWLVRNSAIWLSFAYLHEKLYF